MTTPKAHKREDYTNYRKHKRYNKSIWRLFILPVVVVLMSAIVSRYVALSAAQYITKEEAKAIYLTKEDAKLKYLTSSEYRDMFLKVGEMSGDINYIKSTMEDLKDYILREPPLNH